MFALFLVNLFFAVLTSLFAPTQKVKSGKFSDFDFPQVADGSPFFYFAGRLRLDGANLLWYGDFKSKPIKKRTGLFSKSTVGHKYFLGWQMGLGLGPDVKIHKIWFGNEDPIFTGTLTGDGATTHCKDLGAFGGETGGGGYDLDIIFYPGSSTQVKDTYLAAHVNDGDIPAWRGLSYMVAHGYIGNQTSLNAMTFEVSRVPDPLALGAEALIGSEGDVNPANVIYEMLTNNFGALGVDPTTLNVDSFVDAGHTFFLEDEGISCGFGGSAQKIGDAFQDILKQVDATMYDDPVTGQVYLKLIRPDYNIDDLPRLSGSQMIEVQSYAINLWDDTKNKVRVTFTDRARDYKSDAVAVQEDMSNIGFQGQVKSVNVEYPNIKRAAHAARVGTRELNIYSTPIANVRGTTLRFDMNLRPGSALVFDYPEYQISNLVLRVTKINLGDLINNRLILDMSGDKFANADTIYGVPGPSLFVKPSLGAAVITIARTMEAPRWFNTIQPDVIDADAPRVMALPKAPNSSQQGYDIYARVAGEADYELIGQDIPYPAYAAVHTLYPLSYDYDDVTGIELSFIDDVDALVEATADQIQNNGLNLILVGDEIMGFETFELNGSSRYVLKGIHRALLDTVPADHASGERVVWLSPDSVGQREFVAGDDVEVVLASKAPMGSKDADSGTAMTVPEVI